MTRTLTLDTGAEVTLPDGDIDDLTPVQVTFDGEMHDVILGSLIAQTNGGIIELLDNDGLTAAVGEVHTGGMIALIPEVDDAERLALGGEHAEEAEELHVTFAYLGDAVDWSDEARQLVIDWVRSAIDSLHYDMPVIGDVFGVNLWNIHGEEPSVNLAVGGEDLQSFRDAVMSSFVTGLAEEDSELTPGLPEQHTPWVPHICLGYAPDPTLLREFADRAADFGRFGPVAFDRVRIAFGPDVTDVPIVPEP